MRRGLLAFGIIFLLTISIASAGFLTYYGKVEGIAKVKGPRFYASCTSVDSNIVYKLLINDNSTGDCTPREFTDGSLKWFLSDSLGISSFYPANYSFYVKAKADKPGQILHLELWITDKEGNKKEGGLICDANINITTNETFSSYSAYCMSNSLTLNENDRIAWIMTGGAFTGKYYIDVSHGNTRIEVDKA